MNIRRFWKRATLALLGGGIFFLGGQPADALDLFKKGCCNKGSDWVSHSAPHAVPARAYAGPTPVAMGYQYVPVAPPIAVARQLPGSPPDPVPKWARPPGTVPVVAIQAPAPRWVHPSALAGHQPGPTPNYASTIPGPYGPAPVPYANPPAPAYAPLQQAPLAQPAPGYIPGQPLPAAAPGVPTTSRAVRQSGVILAQGTDLDTVLDDSQPTPGGAVDPGASPPQPVQPTNPQPANPQPGTPLQPLAPVQPVMPQYGQPAPFYGQPAPGYGQPAPAYGAPAQAYARPAPNPNSPYVMAPQPYPVAPAAPRSPAHASKVYGFDDSGKRPPGTLGKTYQRPTRMLDWDKHPRIGQLDVEVLDTLRVGLARDVQIKVTARDIYNHFKPLEGYMDDDGIWHFESEPLLPTVPHIYDVRFDLIRERTEIERRYGRLFERIIEDNLGTIGVRRIRLIPGRIVDLVLY